MSVHAFDMISIPQLPARPRSVGMTSILDKGLGPLQVEELLSTSGEWIDIVKFGWGTARLHPIEVLKHKLHLYHQAGVACANGGTFLEIAYSQKKVGEYLEAAAELGFDIVEVSNGVHPMSQSDKLKLIARVREAGFRVWSEVGKKDADEDARLSIDDRVRAVELELITGSEKVILEARESGTVGLYDKSGKPITALVNRVTECVGTDRIVFEAPLKSQQTWLVRNIGYDVNLGNIAPADAIPVATLRFGLRGDTFPDVHLPKLNVYTGVGLAGALEAKQRGGIVIVIDALRASSTIIAALGEGMVAVKPVATAEECIGEITAGERGGHTLPNCRHANSPSELRRFDYRGKTLTLTTTNGVECLFAAASDNTTILVGTTNNATAVAQVAERMARQRNCPVTLLMSGRHTRETIEDAIAAGDILRAMKGTILHGRVLPQVEDAASAFASGRSGVNLIRLGFREDIEFCARRDVYDVVPILRNGLLVRYNSVMPVADHVPPPMITEAPRPELEKPVAVLTELLT